MVITLYTKNKKPKTIMIGIPTPITKKLQKNARTSIITKITKRDKPIQVNITPKIKFDTVSNITKPFYTNKN